jgi:hypothetical protein
MSNKLATIGGFDPAQLTVALVGNVHKNAGACGYWDTWLTMNGGMVLSPIAMDDDFHPAEIYMADFAQTMKVNKSDVVIIIIDREGRIEEFMLPIINYALSKRIPVYTDVALRGITQQSVGIRSTQLLKELVCYSLDRKGLEEHLDHFQDQEEKVIEPIPPEDPQEVLSEVVSAGRPTLATSRAIEAPRIKVPAAPGNAA